jgi:hypothetical protein
MSIPYKRLAPTIALCLAGVIASPAWSMEALPKVEEIKRGIVARAAEVGQIQVLPGYECVKESISEEFNSKGRLASRQVKTGEGQAVPNGVLSANKWTQKNGVSLDEELLQRFEFKLVRRELINERPAFLLRFSARNQPVSVLQFQERVLNRMTGLVWVDEQDYELVKAHFLLSEPVSLGILGAVESLSFAFERFRAEDGNWLPERTETFFKGRKFLTPVQTRKQVRYSGFRKIVQPVEHSLGSLH